MDKDKQELFKCNISREKWERDVFVEKQFQKQNGGKPSYESLEHGETFTAIFVVQFASECIKKYKNTKL